MPNFLSTKTYTFVTGLFLFLFGIIGFAFKSSFNLADKYLILSIILGLWGIICTFK